MSADLSTSFTSLTQLTTYVKADCITASFNTFGGRKITLKTENKEYTFKMYQLFELVVSLGEKTLSEAKGDKQTEVKEIKDLMAKVTTLDENLKKTEAFPNLFVKIMTTIRRFFGNLMHNRSHIFNALDANLAKTAAPKSEEQNPVTPTPPHSIIAQSPIAREEEQAKEVEAPEVIANKANSKTHSTNDSGSTGDEDVDQAAPEQPNTNGAPTATQQEET